ncbi:hypothetical protein RB195_016119 [Necator americanus]|uniref:BPTI/Kunitz inhibitor domain-containing protein n=1 Tax=Necator americanus TaxID=51031 RepID=A0ABR1E8A3_NECAM
MPRFKEGICQPFMYNGCNGNGNRFESAAECKRICIDGNGATSLQRDDATAGLQASMRSACRAEYSTDHLIPQQCTTAGQSCSSGYQCNAGFCCPTSGKDFIFFPVVEFSP